LKLAPNRAIAKNATALCPIATNAISASPMRIVSATLFWRNQIIGGSYWVASS